MRIPREYVFQIVKGYTGRARKCFKIAIRAAMYSLNRSKIDRRHRKRRFRAFWNVRTNAASREWNMPFSCFIHGLRGANVRVDRKNLAALAMTEPITFKCLVDESKRVHNAQIGLGNRRNLVGF